MFFRFFCVSIFIAFISVTNAFVQTPLNFRAMKNNHVERIRPTQLRMGGNNAQFGIFSPAVYVAKVVLGDAKLNKVRAVEEQ